MAKSKKKPDESGPEVISDLEGSKAEGKTLARRLQGILAQHKDTVGTVHAGSSAAVRLRGVIPTPAATLNRAIGRGGVPFGRVTILTGNEGCGKTTLALELCAAVQQMGGIAIYIDAEHKLDMDYAAALGNDLSELLVSKAKHFEQAAKTITHVIRLVEQDDPGNDVPIVVVGDSLNAMMSEQEWNGEFGDTNMGSQARAFSKGLPKLVAKTAGRKIAYIFISQYRMKITSFGAFQEKVSGGYSPKYYASLVIDLKRKEAVHLSGTSGPVVGHEVHAECVKNQIAKPHQEAMYNIVWGKGIDRRHALLEAAKDAGLANVSSGWWEMPNPWYEAEAVKPDKSLAKADPSDYAQKLADYEFAVKDTLRFQGVNGFNRLVKEVPAVLEYLEGELAKRNGPPLLAAGAPVAEIAPDSAE